MGEEEAGLFHFFFSPPITSRVAFILHDSFDVWHYRLCHLSPTRLSLLNKSISRIKSMSYNPCDICHHAKQHRLPFSASSSTFTYHFSINSLWYLGSFFIPSLDGSRYFLTIVNEFFKCTWIFLMNHKSQTQYYLQYFLTLIET